MEQLQLWSNGRETYTVHFKFEMPMKIFRHCDTKGYYRGVRDNHDERTLR